MGFSGLVPSPAERREQSMVNELETQLACAADLVNSWCRESQVGECKSPYKGLQLREAIDRLWSKWSSRVESQRRECHELRRLLYAVIHGNRFNTKDIDAALAGYEPDEPTT